MPWLHVGTGRKDNTWMVGRHNIGGKASGRTTCAEGRLAMVAAKEGAAGVTNARGWGGPGG